MDWKTLREKIDDELKNGAHFSQIDLDELIDFAFHFVTDSNMKKVKTHQIRRFFDAIKKIKLSVDVNKEKKFENKEKAKLLMLRPQIFNAAKKQWILKDLAEITGGWIKKVDDTEDFYQFVNFFESLVAFHQAVAEQ